MKTVTENETLSIESDASASKPIDINPWVAVAVLGLILLCVGFTFYSAGTWLFGESAQVKAMKEVLRQDLEMKRTIEETNSVTWISKYTREVDDADLLECPPDFQKAYQAHIAVWKELARASQEGQDMGFLAAMWKVGTTSMGDAIKYQEKYNREAESTWSDVEDAAKQHGVTIPEVIHVPFPELPKLKKQLGLK